MSSPISIRPTDSDDVKWALHTASTQVERGSLADAIQWVKRAAQYAEESGDAWRATELQNSARVLAEQMWNQDGETGLSAPPSVDVSIEEVEADELLDFATEPPPNYQNAPVEGLPRQEQPSGGFQSVPPGVVLRQSYPVPGYPVPGYAQQGYPLNNHAGDVVPSYPGGPGGQQLQPRAYPLNSLPGAWQPPPPPSDFGVAPEQQISFAAPPPAFQAQSQPREAMGSAAQPVARPLPGAGAPFVSRAPTLQLGSPHAAESEGAQSSARRRSIRPKAPQPAEPSTRPPPPHRSSSVAGAPGGPDVFSSAPLSEGFAHVQEQRVHLEASRAPMGSAPELLVSEFDLDGAVMAGSLLPPAPSSEPDLTPEEFERDLLQSNDNGVLSSADFEVDPSLADLFAPEEVIEDRDSVDRMSDIVLDPEEFERSLIDAEYPHESLLDDQEETHVLTHNVVQSLRDAVRQGPLAPGQSGEHEIVTRSALPTAPPPESAAPSRGPHSSSADLRRALPVSAAPPMPFEPAPSSPQASRPPSSAGASPASRIPRSRPSISVVPPASPGTAASWGTSPPSAPGPSGVPPSAPGSARSTPPVLVRRSNRANERPGGGPSSAPGGGEDWLESGPPGPSSAPTVQPGDAPPVTATPRARAVSSSAPASGSPFSVPPGSGAVPSLTDPIVDGVNLEETRGFEDLPAEVQLSLASSARVENLQAGEEVSFFGAAVVTSGRVDILPAFSEEAGAVADEGDVIFTHGNLEASIDLRVVAKMDETRVAVWDPETVRNAIAQCPWVADELKLIADRYLALCGATLGPLGERLDDSLRATVFQRLEVRTYAEGDILAEAGKPIPGLLVIGGGRVLLRKQHGEQTGELNMGDFVFASELLGGSKAPETAVAARGGALVLTAPRQVAHELMMSVPPLVEVLAG